MYVRDEDNLTELNKKILMRYEEEVHNKNCFCRFADPFSLLVKIYTFAKGNEEEEEEEEEVTNVPPPRFFKQTTQ